jgi:hypothetical protein
MHSAYETYIQSAVKEVRDQCLRYAILIPRDAAELFALETRQETPVADSLSLYEAFRDKTNP